MRPLSKRSAHRLFTHARKSPQRGPELLDTSTLKLQSTQIRCVESSSAGWRRSTRVLIFVSLGLPTLFLPFESCSSPAISQSPAEAIRVFNRGDGSDATPRTKYDSGPCVGDILNYHFFPGLLDYQRGNYRYALTQMEYVVERPHYTSMNPRQAQIMGMAHYVSGSIYLDHSEGSGRLARALSAFRLALQWQPDNQPAALGLARTYAIMGHTNEAVTTLQDLLAKQPPAPIKEEAAAILKELAARRE